MISTVIGDINLWDDKDIELSEINADKSKRKVILKFLVSDNEGTKSTDKLKIYGVNDFDEIISNLRLIKPTINQIDLRKKNKVKLLNRRGTILQTIKCDKFVFNQKKQF